MSVITYSQSEREHTEGVGSLYQRELLAYLISLFFNSKFERSILFFYKKHNKNIFIKKFDQLFDFFGKKKNKNIYSLIKQVKNINELKKNKFIYNLPFHLSEKLFSKFSFKKRKELINKFRKEFWEFNKKNLIKKKDKKYNTIVLHIRNRSKGDVIFGELTFPYQIFSYDYNLPDHNPIFYSNWYLSLVKKIIIEKKLFNKKIKIYICSTGLFSDFSYLYNKLKKIAPTKLFLNKEEFRTFRLMIEADYLIMAQSSFSYLASFINRGSKYIRNGFRHVLPADVTIIKDYKLLNTSYSYYIYCRTLELFLKLKLFIKNTDFTQILKNKFKTIF
jgi:hypothetical protein